MSLRICETRLFPAPPQVQYRSLIFLQLSLSQILLPGGILIFSCIFISSRQTFRKDPGQFVAVYVGAAYPHPIGIANSALARKDVLALGPGKSRELSRAESTQSLARTERKRGGRKGIAALKMPRVFSQSQGAFV